MNPANTAVLPSSPAGSPPTPGASPMAAPGAGAGNTAAAVSALKGAFSLLYRLLSAFPPGSEDWKNASKMIEYAGKIVGKEPDDSAVPSAIRQMALAAKGNPMRSAPPIAVQPANAEVKPAQEAEPV